MSYESKEWVCGDTITADDLNRIEEGVADASGKERFVVTFSQNNNEWSADKTRDEILDAWNNGKEVVGAKDSGMGGLINFPLTEVSNPGITFSYIYGHAANGIGVETFTMTPFTPGVIHKQSMLTVS